MKLIPILFFAWCSMTSAQESYFFKTLDTTAAPRVSIKSDELIMAIGIKKIPPPKASAISAFHQGYGGNRDFQITVTLREKPAKKWNPTFKLGDDIFFFGVSVQTPNEPQFAPSFTIESNDPKKIHQWVSILAKLLSISDDNITVDLKVKKH